MISTNKINMFYSVPLPPGLITAIGTRKFQWTNVLAVGLLLLNLQFFMKVCFRGNKPISNPIDVNGEKPPGFEGGCSPLAQPIEYVLSNGRDCPFFEKTEDKEYFLPVV
ncbi:hypothetical protein KIL84_007971 [Mauremys mutica]|uniref:Uncharacterized protein n=1 Tax=Mauremys mutica TaxID=74926 RepID=A0A9D3X446_9SAUR|nr:hypothetical protein KIL84_007971 [Mauremys mutica]